MGTNQNRPASLYAAIKARYEKAAAEQTPPDPAHNRRAAWGASVAARLDAAADAAQDPVIAAGLSAADRATIAQWRLRQRRHGGDDAA
jgi:hypothetical protein